MSEIRGSNFTIINKDGKVIAKGDEVHVRHAGSVFLPTNAIPDLKRHDWKAEATCTMKLSKRKGRKFSYDIKRLFCKRTPKYITKRELLNIYQQNFFQQGLLMPIDDYLKHTHRQLMNLLVNTAYLVKKERESRHIFTPLPQVETPIEQYH